MLEAMLDGLKNPDGTKGVDSAMYITNFPPGSVSARHTHPGWEYNYILKGAVTYDIVGQASFTVTARDSGRRRRPLQTGQVVADMYWIMYSR